jgi:MFS family permease
MLVQDGLPSRERLRALLVIILGIVMAVLDGTIVNLALPDITRELNATPAQSIWVINAYQVATLALLLPLATLGDIVGYRRVYLAGMAVFTLASLLCALADSLTTLALARMLQGLGAAGLMSVNTALVRLIYPKHLLGRGIAINSLVVATASVAGPSIAAGILSVASWPWLFALNVPFGVLSLWWGRKALPENTAKVEGLRLSPVDVVLNALMFGLVFLGVDGLGVRIEAVPGGAVASFLWLPLAELAAGIVIGVIYVRRQLAMPVPLFPLDLLRIPVFALSMGTSIGAFCAQTLAYISLPFLLLGSYGFSHRCTSMRISSVSAPSARRTPAWSSSRSGADAPAAPAMSHLMRPGRALITTTRLPMKMASSMSWVTNSTVLRSSFPDAQQQLLHQLARLVVQRAERFVHQQDARVVGQRAGQRGALLHAARQLLGVVLLETLQAHLADELGARWRAARPAACPSRAGRSTRCPAR